MKTITLLAALSLGAAPVQEIPKPTPPTPQHTWLQQLVGEWNVTCEVLSGPDSPPLKFESTESARSFGGLWVLGEGKILMDGSPMTTLLTLGYDTQEKTFVGSWIDTMQTRLWTYRGSLDDAMKTLTLESSGPRIDDPTKTAKYRDMITIVGPDHKRHTSTIQGDDGKWTQYMSADYHRKK